MATMNAGKVKGGEYLDTQLFINEVNLGALTVQPDDEDGTLRDAISAVEGVSASLDSGNNLVISSNDTLTVAGTLPCGVENMTVRGMMPGVYD